MSDKDKKPQPPKDKLPEVPKGKKPDPPKDVKAAVTKTESKIKVGKKLSLIKGPGLVAKGPEAPVAPKEPYVDDFWEKCQTPVFIYGGPFIPCKKPEIFIDARQPLNFELQGTFKKSFAYYSMKERLPVILTKIIDNLSKKGDPDSKKLIEYIAKLKNEIVTNKKMIKLKLRLGDEEDDKPKEAPKEPAKDGDKAKAPEKPKDDTLKDTVQSYEEAKRWNAWLEERDFKTYFTDIWVFSECYVYRRLREGVELIPTLKNYDPFAEQKKQSFETGKEAMCMIAKQVMPMLTPEEDKDKRKQNFMTLLKVCLWANKCDLSLSLGEPMSLLDKAPDTPPPGAAGEKAEAAAGTPAATAAGAAPAAGAAAGAGAGAGAGAAAAAGAAPGADAAQPKTPAELPALDPFQLVIDYKDKLLADDTSKIADQVVNKAENIRKAIENAQKDALAAAAALKAAGKGKKGKTPPPPPPPAPPAAGPDGAPPPEPPPPKPCPAKVLIPSRPQFDIVCDNAGLELFADLCLATFLIEQKIVDRIRFYVKKIPWFVSDVMPNDFIELIQMCCTAQYSRRAPPPEPKKPLAEGETPPGPTDISSAELNALGIKFAQYVKDQIFVISCEDFWTSPHVFRDMKKYDYWLYRKLQYAAAVLFKGDLNYRKLVGEKCWAPTTPFLQCLQGFQPAPLIACRTVKCELICGLKKGKSQAATKVDPNWMQKGDYGVIQFCTKAEPLKVADRPCEAYCAECLGLSCPETEPFW